jgi:GDPmannose 4,6-dehydratase
MLQQAVPDDYVIATGASYQLEDFIEVIFATLGLDWRDHVETDESLLRPSEIMKGQGNPTKAKDRLGWQAAYQMPDVARMMVEAEQAHQKGAVAL